MLVSKSGPEIALFMCIYFVLKKVILVNSILVHSFSHFMYYCGGINVL